MSGQPSPLKSAVITPSAGPNFPPINAPVVVHVSRRHTESVAPGVDSTLLGHIREVQCPRAVRKNAQVVAVQPSPERQAGGPGRYQGIRRGLATGEHVPLNDVDIEIAVVVVIEQRDARWKDLGIVELAGAAVEMHEVKARGGCLIAEPLFRKG